MGHKPFNVLLRSEMQRQNLSVRLLGKMIEPDDPELGRRRVQRHLTGTIPTEASRAAYARVLDAPHLAECCGAAAPTEEECT